jgi:hypothetical protein
VTTGGVNLQNGDTTLWAVVLGAVLATFSGFVANQLEASLHRRERERAAALLFGEILSVLDLLTTMAHEARGRGEPYGPFTMRLLRALRREVDTYDRYRDALYDLRDPKLRGQIHALMVRVTVSLDSIAETSAMIGQIESDIRALHAEHPERVDVLARLETLLEAREGSFDFAVEAIGRAPPIITMLRPLAKQDFGVYASIIRDPGT